MGGKIVVQNQPCLSCPSHDARQVYDNGTSYCFSCQTYFDKEKTAAALDKSVEFKKEEKKVVEVPAKKSELEDIKDYALRELKDRGISKKVCEHFGVRVSYSPQGEIDAHFYQYDENSYKVRTLPKDFRWINKSEKLFGQTKFPPGGKRLVITEGEIDALSVGEVWFQKYDRVYPVVAIPSASQTDHLLNNRDWIRSFDSVVLCFDNDEAGKKALEKAIKIVGIDKAKIVTLPPGCKDANDVLKKDGWHRLYQCVMDASPFVPTGIIKTEELWESLKNYNSIPAVPYPPCIEGVNTKLKGMRPGEITLFISGTGSGKSTILREIMLHILATTQEKIGVVSLEESPAETARKLAGMVLNKNPAKEEIPIDELKTGFDQVFGEDRIILLDHQGAIDDTSIIDQLEYMCLVGCKYLFIDHITILVSEGMEDLTGNEAQDKVMNELLKLVKRHPVWIGLVSHLRKAGGGKKSFEEGRLPSIDDIRGSGSIKQISFDIISFARDLTAVDEKSRNTILMQILKARQTGLTGKIPGARYSYDTGRLSYCEETDQFTSLD
jgi:twinkle protein